MFYAQQQPQQPPIKTATLLLRDVEKTLQRVANKYYNSANVKPSRAFTGWMKQRKREFTAKDETSAFLERCEYVCVENEEDQRRLPTVNEKRARELFEDFKEQSSTFAVLLVPGLWGHHYPGYYVTVRDMFRSIDIECEISRVNSEGSVKENARTVKDEIEALCENKNKDDEKRRKRVLAMGHSKGGLDIAAALALFETELEDKLAGFVCVQSPYGGSPIAEDLLSNKYVR